MAHVRIWLEVFKFLNPKELLAIESVSTQWKSWSCRDEVWQQHVIVPSDFRSNRDLCRTQLFRPQFIANIYLNFEVYYPRTQQLKILSFSDFEKRLGAVWTSLPNAFFYCGGYKTPVECVAHCFLLLISSLSVQRLPDMIMKRAESGLAYFDEKVYVFGGAQSINETEMRECEKFSFEQREWTPLPSMNSKRSHFLPARLKSLFYITGGYMDFSIEIFSLVSETFQPNASLRLKACDDEMSAFAFDNTLVVLANSRIYQYDLQNGALINKKKLCTGFNNCSYGGAITFNDMTYFVLSDEIIAVSERLESDWITKI